MLYKKFKSDFDKVYDEVCHNKNGVNVENYVVIMEKLGYLFKPST
jgi:hypothetical protein